jgi:hypothetical protein
MPARRVKMEKHYEGLPAAANVEQSIILAQLQILRKLERATRAGIAPIFVSEPGAAFEAMASWSPAEE